MAHFLKKQKKQCQLNDVYKNIYFLLQVRTLASNLPVIVMTMVRLPGLNTYLIVNCKTIFKIRQRVA